MRGKKEFLFNTLLILVYILISFMEDYIGDKENLGMFWKYYLFLKLTFLITSLVIYILNYKGTLRFLLQKKYWQYGVFFVGLVIIFGSIRFFLEEVILFQLTGIHNYDVSISLTKLLSTYGFDSFYYTFRIVLISTLVCLVFKNSRDRKAIYELGLAHQEAQLATLKSQISPHFLFNTLNNFYVELYDDKPETAKDILKLSQLLRYVTYETLDDFVSLKKEISFVSDYLHFFKRRYENDFNVVFNITGTIAKQKILPLILIHFIENVCKHGIINDKDRKAVINLQVTENELELSTINYNNTSEKHDQIGIGSTNIKKRLTAIYKEHYTLEELKNNGTFKTCLKIKL